MLAQGVLCSAQVFVGSIPRLVCRVENHFEQFHKKIISGQILRAHLSVLAVLATGWPSQGKKEVLSAPSSLSSSDLEKRLKFFFDTEKA